ncbi:MAG: phosphatase PAP2 family protein [Egibacteraceae bacterium]
MRRLLPSAGGSVVGRWTSWPLRAALGTGLLAGTWFALQRPEVQRADVAVGDRVREAGDPRVDRVVTYTTDLGSLYSVLGVAGVLAVTGRRRVATDVLGVGAAAWNLAQVNKRRVRRQRPYQTDGVRRLIRKPTGSSFPSGHAAVGAAMFWLLGDQARDTWGRRILQAVGIYVGASRVYVGVHYPTDVFGGFGMGLAVAALWRGPVAAVNAAAVGFGTRTLRRYGPRALQLAGLAAVTVLRWRRATGRGAVQRSAAPSAPERKAGSVKMS